MDHKDIYDCLNSSFSWYGSSGEIFWNEACMVGAWSIAISFFYCILLYKSLKLSSSIDCYIWTGRGKRCIFIYLYRLVCAWIIHSSSFYALYWLQQPHLTSGNSIFLANIAKLSWLYDILNHNVMLGYPFGSYFSYWTSDRAPSMRIALQSKCRTLQNTKV